MDHHIPQCNDSLLVQGWVALPTPTTRWPSGRLYMPYGTALCSSLAGVYALLDILGDQAQEAWYVYRVQVRADALIPSCIIGSWILRPPQSLLVVERRGVLVAELQLVTVLPGEPAPLVPRYDKPEVDYDSTLTP